MRLIRQTVVSLFVFFSVQAFLCIIYTHTYTSVNYDFNGRFHGIVYWVMLMIAFLAGPVCYYVAGLLRKDKGNKKVTLGIAFVSNAVVAVMGIAAFFVPWFLDIYRLVNAPSYLYYSLFSDSVMYIAVPAMIASSLFPVLFFKLGFTKKPRRNNQLEMDEVKNIESQNKNQQDGTRIF